MSQGQPTIGEIEGNEYKMYPLAPSQSMDLLIDVVSVLSPVVAPVLGAIFGGKGSTVDASILDKEVTGDMFSDAFSKLDAQQLKSLRKKLTTAFAPITYRNNVPLEKTWEKDFFGNIGEMFKWLAWGCKVHWGQSLSALGSVIPSQSAEDKQ